MKVTRRTLLWLLVPLGILALLALWPLPRSFVYPEAKKAVQVMDRNGQLLYEIRPSTFGSHEFVMLKDIPKTFLQAVVSIEDRTFYSHGGVSIRGILRAAWQNFSEGQIVSGGSTITQQLVRNRLQPKRRTVLYKIWEAFLAWKLDLSLSKDDILESYLNTAYFGHRAYGLKAACSTFFGKSPQEISIAEAALLAGLLQSPSAYDPYTHLAAAKERRTLVLQAMRETEVITEQQYNDALSEKVSLRADTVNIEAPHFVFWLQETRPELFENVTTVTTTLDLALQKQIERIIQTKLQELADKHVTSSAVIVLDAHKGDVLAMVGSADYFDQQNDGAVNVAVSPRQPGSAIKPFTYALALGKGDTPATTVADIETQFFTQEGNPYTPRNYDFGFHGLVRYREALANSYNIAAVKVLQKVGVSSLLGFLRSAGIRGLNETPEHYGLALTLGDAEVSLLDLTKAYAIFPRGGRTLELRTVPTDPVKDGRQILDQKVAWLISDILSDNSARLPEFGPDSALAFSFPVAAKTGTTRNSRDNWTIGYTPDVIVGVWVGNADNSPMQGTSGVTGAGPIFHDVMEAAVKLFPSHPFTMPAGIVQREICALSGKLPSPDCPHTITEYFIEGTEPKVLDDLYTSVSIDLRNGLLATASCPAQFVQKKSFAVFPPDVQKWARENGWPSVPSEQSPLCSGTALSSMPSIATQWLTITKPHQGDSFELDPLIPSASQRVILEASASSDIRAVSWYIDGIKVANSPAPDYHASWTPTLGTHTMEVRSNNLHQKIFIEVTKAGSDRY